MSFAGVGAGVATAGNCRELQGAAGRCSEVSGMRKKPPGMFAVHNGHPSVAQSITLSDSDEQD